MCITRENDDDFKDVPIGVGMIPKEDLCPHGIPTRFNCEECIAEAMTQMESDRLSTNHIKDDRCDCVLSIRAGSKCWHCRLREMEEF